MHAALATLLDRLDRGAVADADVIPWGCPVPAFGDLDRARVATLGLNPSNREFVDERGRELRGTQRRFHTLQSLGLAAWSEADARHLRAIGDACRGYFSRNPYDGWFRRLERVVAGADASFYGAAAPACHLDLIPYATARKWGALAPPQRAALLAAAGDTLGLLLRSAPVRVLILNGRAVVDHFEQVASVDLERQQVPAWTLPRQGGPGVPGVAYWGTVDSVGGVSLGREVAVLGFNHNLQSSYGVTNQTIGAVRQWISRMTRGLAS